LEKGVRSSHFVHQQQLDFSHGNRGSYEFVNFSQSFLEELKKRDQEQPEPFEESKWRQRGYEQNKKILHDEAFLVFKGTLGKRQKLYFLNQYLYQSSPRGTWIWCGACDLPHSSCP